MRPALSPVFVLFAALMLPAAAAAQDVDNPSFVLANRADVRIDRLYATVPNVDNWGPDRMARFSLAPGVTMPIRLPVSLGCVYDLRVIYADGRTEERRAVDTCRVDSVAFSGRGATGAGHEEGAGQAEGQEDDPSFRLVNRSRVEVRSVYASPSGDDDWGRDRLGEDVVPGGRSYVVDLPRGECRYDVLVVFANKRRFERRRVDLCAVTDFRVP